MPDRSNGRIAAPAFSRSQTLAVLSALAADEPLAIGRKTDSCDRPLMALERQRGGALRSQFLSVRPDLDRPFGIRRGQLAPSPEKVIAEIGRRVSGRMLRDRAACGCVVNGQRLRTATCRQRSAGHPDSTRRHSTFHSTRASLASGVTVFAVASRRKIENELRRSTVADDRQRQTIGRQAPSSCIAASNF